VDPGLRPGRVGIVADERDFPRSFGQAGPVQDWGYVLPLARVFRWDEASRFEEGLDTSMVMVRRYHRSRTGPIEMPTRSGQP